MAVLECGILKVRTFCNSHCAVWLNSIPGPYCGQSEKPAADALVSHPTVTKQRVVQLGRCSQAALKVWPGPPCLTLWSASGNPALYGLFAFTPYTLQILSRLWPDRLWRCICGLSCPQRIRKPLESQPDFSSPYSKETPIAEKAQLPSGARLFLGR